MNVINVLRSKFDKLPAAGQAGFLISFLCTKLNHRNGILVRSRLQLVNFIFYEWMGGGLVELECVLDGVQHVPHLVHRALVSTTNAGCQVYVNVNVRWWNVGRITIFVFQQFAQRLPFLRRGR